MKDSEPNFQARAFTLDEFAFFVNVPPQLAGDQVTGAVPLFTVAIGGGILPGTYTGSITLLGGLSDADFDELTTQIFQVTVMSAADPVPEPATIILLATGLAGIVGSARGRRRARRRVDDARASARPSPDGGLKMFGFSTLLKRLLLVSAGLSALPCLRRPSRSD